MRESAECESLAADENKENGQLALSNQYTSISLGKLYNAEAYEVQQKQYCAETFPSGMKERSGVSLPPTSRPFTAMTKEEEWVVYGAPHGSARLGEDAQP